MLRKLETHLAGFARKGRIDDWHDGKNWPGDDREKQIHGRLSTAQIILLLVSSDFISLAIGAAPSMCLRL